MKEYERSILNLIQDGASIFEPSLDDLGWFSTRIGMSRRRAALGQNPGSLRNSPAAQMMSNGHTMGVGEIVITRYILNAPLNPN